MCGASSETLTELYAKIAQENIALRNELAKAQAEVIRLLALQMEEGRKQ